MLLNFIITLAVVAGAVRNMYYVDDVVIFAMVLGLLYMDFVIHIIFIVGTYKVSLIKMDYWHLLKF